MGGYDRLVIELDKEKEAPMTKFKDSKGREWTIALTIGRARSVLDQTGVDLLQPEAGKVTLPQILTDEYKVAEILGVLLDSEFKRLGIDPACMMREDWDGGTSQAAYKALLEELTSFFVARGQSARANVVTKTNEAVMEVMTIMGERVANLDPAKEIRRLADEDSARLTDGSTSGKPQGEPDSSPGA